MFLTNALLLYGVLTYAVANDLCLNKTEYDFYIMGNLVKDFEDRIQSLKQNVKEVLKEKYPMTSCPDRVCADDWVSYNGSCYFFENARTYNFEEARVFCKGKGSVILHIKDEPENLFILRMLGRLKSGTNWFLGLTDQSSEGKYIWADTDVSATFIKWAPGEPTGNRGQNCVVYHKDDSYRWHDVGCYNHSVICEKEI